MTRFNSLSQPRFRGALTNSVRLALSIGLAMATVPAIAAADNPGQGNSDQTPLRQGQTPAPSTNPALSDGTIGKAGAALRDVAKVQQNYQGKIDSAVSNEEKRGLTSQANAEAVKAIQSHGLSIQEYASVVQTARADPQVRQRLLAAANIR